VPTGLEKDAFNESPVPGEMFTRYPTAKQQEQQWARCPEFGENEGKEVHRDVVVSRQDIVYNHHGWHDPGGHLFYLADEGDPGGRHGTKEPLFFRAQHGQPRFPRPGFRSLSRHQPARKLLISKRFPESIVRKLDDLNLSGAGAILGAPPLFLAQPLGGSNFLPWLSVLDML